MKILMVCHNYPPAHTAGTETYTAELARRLVARGHRVHVVTTEKDIARPDLSLTEREHRGVPVTELTNNLLHRSFRETWDHPRIASLFGELLDRERPDVVHVQHLLYLSIGCVEAAAERCLPVVFTLHDFWLQCPRFGQRVHVDGALCETIDTARCGTCMARFKFAQSPLERRTARAIAGLKQATGVDLSGAARGAARLLAPGAPGWGAQGSGASADSEPGTAPEADPDRAAAFEREVLERQRAIRERLIGKVQRFLSPSRFLRDELIAFGIPADRIEHLPTGIDRAAFGRRAATEPAASEPRTSGPRTSDQVAPLRVGFVGSLVPLKGPGLLLEAWSRIDASLRSGARLELHGPGDHHPAFQAELAERAAAVGAELAGPAPREAVPALLASLDVLVVPSLWYENAPLIILEARAVGTPVVVSDVGGMAELVEDGANGRHFRFGDADDLARVLTELLARPESLAELNGGPPVHDGEADADRMEAIYAELLAARGGGP